MAEIINIDAPNDTASKILEAYIQSGNINFLIGSGASSPAIGLAGQIEKEINAHLEKNEEDEAHRKCLDLLEAINAVHKQIPTAASGTEIREVAERYKLFISVVDKILFARKNILLPRQASIFTTNYDMFIEHASGLNPGIILNDGFNRSSSLDAASLFTPERFFDRTYRAGPIFGNKIEIPTINLVRLHGSMSWRRTADTIAFESTTIPNLTTQQKANSDEVNSYIEKHFLILPNMKKFHATLVERVYYDLLRLFSKAMDYENSLLIAFGFSFSDEHILDLTRRALRNPTAQLIIMSHDEPSAAIYKEKFLRQRNVLILAPSAGTLDLKQFSEILRSILPGDANAH